MAPRARERNVYPIANPQTEKRWIVRIVNPATRREVSKTFERKQDAITWRDETRRSFRTGTYVDENSGRIPFKEVAEHWLATRSVKPSTLRSYEDLLRSRILRDFGKRSIGSITESDVELWVASLRDEGLSPSRIRKLILVTRQIFKIAVRDGRIAVNPVSEEIRAPRQREPEVVALDIPEVIALTAALPEHFRLPTLFLASTGLRMSEMVALKKKHLTMTPGKETVFVEDALVELSNQKGRLIPGAPKTWHRRHVGIPAHLVPPLTKHIADLGQEDHLWMDDRRAGKVMRPSRYAEMIKRARLAAGITKPVTPKILRSTAITQAIRSGASVVTAQRMAGHQNASITLRHYTAFFPDDFDSVRTRLDDAWADALTEVDESDILAGDAE